MECDIHWNTASLDDWTAIFNAIPRSNLLQSYAYARAQSAYALQRPQYGVITIDGQTAGLCTLMENSLFWKALHTVILDRGPLWCPGFGGAVHTKCFFETFNRRFPKRFGRARRIIPEIAQSPAADKILQSTGLAKKETQAGYETIWLDLSPETDDLRANLKQKWRNILNKSERSPLETKWFLGAQSHTAFQDFKIAYAAHKAAKGYSGPTPKFLDHLARIMTQSGDMVIGQADVNNRAVGAVMLVKHGRSATYLAGWTDTDGRTHGAHHLLLWQGITMLKEQGINELDLGGINDQSAHGIKKFKDGLGGQPVTLLGQYA